MTLVARAASGSGLYIVHGLVEAMGGTISVASSPGGTRFEVRLQRADAAGSGADGCGGRAGGGHGARRLGGSSGSGPSAPRRSGLGGTSSPLRTRVRPARAPRYPPRVVVLEVLLWVSLALILWTHVGYPLLAAAAGARRAAARARRRRAADGRARDHRPQRGGRDRGEARERARARLPARAACASSSRRTPPATAPTTSCAASPTAASSSSSPSAAARSTRRTRAMRALGDAIDVVAFSDANSTWSPDALRQLRARRSPTPTSPTSAAASRCAAPTGTNQEGAYWKLEVALRAQESAIGSITGGNGSIYAVRRERYAVVDPRWGHDLVVPVPDGQARPPRGLRVRRRGGREAVDRPRGRVPPQGAHVRPLLAARLPRPHVQPAPHGPRSTGCR